jgi:uncharacterized membrane protein
MSPRTLLRRAVPAATAAAALAGVCAALAGLLFAACAAFSWKNFLMSDYGVYTNALWNAAHGNGFAFLLDHDYLRTHLSFSLALAGVLFRVWDHPMLLLCVQWAFLAGGTAVLARMAMRLNVPRSVAWAVLFVFTACFFTQRVLLSEFHGVSAYLVLLPWLVYCVRFRRQRVFLPFMLLLGLREDAGLLLPLFFLYEARRARWRAGYGYALAAAVYAALAIGVLYPALHGESVAAMRMDEESAFDIWRTLDGAGVRSRLVSLAWAAAPAVAVGLCAGGGWRPLLLLPFVPLVLALGSGLPRQFELRFHYPAALLGFLGPALLLGWHAAAAQRRRQRPVLCALALIGLTLAGHRLHGFLPGGAEADRVYRSIQADGRATLAAAARAPAAGVLLCDRRLAVFAANREAIMTWQYWTPAHGTPDAFFFHLDLLHRPAGSLILAALRAGTHGAQAIVFPYVIVARGAVGPLTETLMRHYDDKTLAAGTMARGGGRNVWLPEHGLVRHWQPSPGQHGAIVAHGASAALDAGAYRAVFLLQGCGEGRPAGPGAAGTTLSVHKRGETEALAALELDSVPPGPGFHAVALAFRLDAPERIEPRIAGGGAAFRALSVHFRRAEFVLAGAPPRP